MSAAGAGVTTRHAAAQQPASRHEEEELECQVTKGTARNSGIYHAVCLFTVQYS